MHPGAGLFDERDIMLDTTTRPGDIALQSLAHHAVANPRGVLREDGACYERQRETVRTARAFGFFSRIGM